MKTLKLILFGILIQSSTLFSQVSVNINFGPPPAWAPADRIEVQYYYLPEFDIYYDVPAARFIYIRNGKWYRSANLPAKYRNHNLRGSKIIYLTDYRGSAPYKFHKHHKVKYRNNGTVYVVKETNHKHKHGKKHDKGKRKND